MPISIQCGSCGQTYQAADNVAGKRVRCRQCGAAIPVPQLGLPQQPEPILTPQLIQEAFPPPGQPLQWPGMAAYGASARRRGGNPWPIIVSILGVSWAGYIGYHAFDQIGLLANALDRVGAQAPIALIELLLIRVGQLFC